MAVILIIQGYTICTNPPLLFDTPKSKVSHKRLIDFDYGQCQKRWFMGLFSGTNNGGWSLVNSSDCDSYLGSNESIIIIIEAD